MVEISNMQKYEYYKEQIGRLKRALNNHFYLEAFLLNKSLWRIVWSRHFVTQYVEIQNQMLVLR